MVPLRDGGKNGAAKIVEDGVKALSLLGRGGGQRVDELAGLDGGQDGIAANVGEVAGNPVYAGVRGSAEVFHVARPGLRVVGIGQIGIGQKRIGHKLIGHKCSGKLNFTGVGTSGEPVSAITARGFMRR